MSTQREAEEARLRYLYRDRILRGRTRLPWSVAVKLIGPDCAWRLYSLMPDKEEEATGGGSVYDTDSGSR